MAGQPGNYSLKQSFWQGGEFQDLGSGIYYKKVAFVSLQIYTVAIYLEPEVAGTKLKQLRQAGYFKDTSPHHVCDIINQPGFKKVLHIKLLRDVSTSRFISEMSKDLTPRLERTGDGALLKQFTTYLQDKQIKTGCSLACLWDEADTLAGGLYPPGFNDWPHAQPALGIKSAIFARAMFGMYIDEKSVTPDLLKVWTKGILALLN